MYHVGNGIRGKYGSLRKSNISTFHVSSKRTPPSVKTSHYIRNKRGIFFLEKIIFFSFRKRNFFFLKTRRKKDLTRIPETKTIIGEDKYV